MILPRPKTPEQAARELLEHHRRVTVGAGLERGGPVADAIAELAFSGKTDWTYQEAKAGARPMTETTSKKRSANMLQDIRIEYIKTLCTVRGYEPPKKTRTYGPAYTDHRDVGKGIASMSDETATQFINDCIYARELMVATWSDQTPTKLLAAAEAQGVDVKAIRKSMAPAAKKKVKKKGSKKKASGRLTATRKKKKATKKSVKKKASKKSKNAPAATGSCLYCGKSLVGKRKGAKYCDGLHQSLARDKKKAKSRRKAAA